MKHDVPLILVIEPNQMQAAQLSTAIQRRLTAEVVVTHTPSRALAALDARVPDLILIPPLFPPHDEAALVEALRATRAAAHVQILTIPTLTPAPSEAPRRILPLWRKTRESEIVTNGCDPSAFADQIAKYLQRMAEKRSTDDGPSVIRDDSDLPERLEQDAQDVQVPDDAELTRIVAAAETLVQADSTFMRDGVWSDLDPARCSFAFLLSKLYECSAESK